MNKSNKNEMITRNGYHYPYNVIDQRNVTELPVFGDKKQKALSQQRKKNVLKPTRRPDTSAARQQSGLPKNTIDTNRIGADSDTNNMLLNVHVMRIKNLENKLSEANAKNHELTTENRLLKIQEKRLEHALSEHEGEQAKLPQIIKSYEEDIRTLKSRIRQMKTSFTEMESRYKSQTNELFVLQKQHTHLLSLPKKEESSTINKLHDRLEKAYSTIKQQQSEILNFKRKIELQNKKHIYHPDLERSLQKQTLHEIKRCSDKIENIGLESKHLNTRQGSAEGTTENSIDIAHRVAKPIIRGQGDVIDESFNKTDAEVSLKPELPYKKRVDKNKSYKNREKWQKY